MTALTAEERAARRSKPYWYVSWLEPRTGREGRSPCGTYDAVTASCRILNERRPSRWYQACYDATMEVTQ